MQGKETGGVMGIVRIQLRDSKGNIKPIFQGNKLWEVLNKALHLDIAIPYITGKYVPQATYHNLVTTRGKQVVADLINGQSSTYVRAMAIGTGTTAAAASDTALETEITTGGGARAAATRSTVTTTTTNDTARFVHTWTFTASFAVTEEGLFDNSSSGGNMLSRKVFSAVNVNSGDSLQYTHDIQITT